MISGRLISLREQVPGSGQAWRQYAAEVTVVLIGVLIALGTDRADDRFAEPSPLNPQEVHRSRQLAVLQSDPALSSEERRRLIATIAELGTINAAMGLNANQLIDRYHALGEDYRTPPKVLADAKEAIGDIRKGNRAT